MEKIIVRFPPSPTGKLHLGSARTALFNFLFAKKNGGEIIFRFENTDKIRSKKIFENEILENLKWLGLDFSAQKIFRQSENLENHQKILQKLWDENKIFPCFLSTDEIQKMRESAAAAKKNFVFWSPFRDEKKINLQKKIDAGEKFVWRFRAPKNREIIFEDLIRGKIAVNSATIGDFAIGRDDGSVLYLAANVFDDAADKISHIIRGEDGISNTPRQILIFAALEKKIPIYAHIPLVLDKNGKKLSKRNTDPEICVLISDFRKMGFLPAAVLNGLAFLGWNPKTTDEIFSLENLEKIFELKNVNSAGAKYDFEKMKFFNKKWLEKMPLENLEKYFKNWCAEFWPEKKIFLAAENFKIAFCRAKKNAKILTDFFADFEYLCADPKIEKEKIFHEKFGIDKNSAPKILEKIAENLEKIPEKNFTEKIIFEKMCALISAENFKNGQIFHPFRAAISNRKKSAPPHEIAEILGKKETLHRIFRAAKL